VQPDQLAEFGQPNALAVMGDLFEDREGAASDCTPTRWRSSGIVVDIVVRRRLHQLGDGGLARSGRLLSGLLFDTRTSPG